MTQSFTFGDVLALMGLTQSLYLIIYILLRAGQLRSVIVPTLCLSVLSFAFLSDFATPRLSDWEVIPFLRNLFWISVPSFSALLIRQVADFGRLPPSSFWLTLLLPLLSAIIGYGFFKSYDAMMILGIISGCISFLILWAGRRSFSDLRDDKVTKGERYWLIISFIIMNILIISVSLLTVSGYIPDSQFNLIRDILGMGMVYLASTSLLRIYPQTVKLIEKKSIVKDLSEQDKTIIDKIKNLLDLDKIYQEPNFSRADLARELNISEANVSRIIMAHFEKSLPQLINELRIRDSLQLLQQTEATMSVVAEQVGFASLPTFNRVFKDVMGMAPTEYRQKKS